MTISDGDNRKQYTGNGVTDTFSTGTIVFYDDTDLIVTERVIATGVETQYVLTTDYTVTGGDGAAGSITLTAGALPATKTITIERSIPYEQQEDYKEGEAILAEPFETSLDKVVIMAQQIKYLTDISVKLSATLSTALKPKITQAPEDGKILAWSGTGGDIINVSLADLSASLDVVLTSLASGDFLQYNGSSWINKTTAEVKTALGLKQNNYAATTTPGIGDDSDDGYSIGSQWYDGTNDNMYHCLDATVGAAVWVQGDIVAADLGSAAVAALIDDDTFATATSSNIPSAESVKTYVDTEVAGAGADSNQLAKVWANFDGTSSITTRDSYNVTSIVRNGTGDYTITFDTDFANVNYAYFINSDEAYAIPSSKAVGSIRFLVKGTGGANNDADDITFVAFGDQ